MKKLKLFSLLMLLFVGVTSMWGAPTAATVTKGTNCTDVTINSKSAVKVGTSKNSGDLTLTVGTGATKLSFYAAAWKGSTGLNINVSAPKGVTLSASTVTLIPHDNVTGSFTSITVSPEADYLCELTLSGVSTETAITVSSGTMIRFAIWGATYEVASSCSNTVTITKGAETNGTYTLSATSVCGDGDGEDVTISGITPAPGYEFDEITTSASGTVDNVNKKVTGIKANTTITVKFKALPSYTVTWNVNGDESRTSSVYQGSKPTFPTPAPTSCDATSTTFIGWATEAWAGKLASISAKTVYTSADAMPAVTEAVTYYAVFAKSSGAAGKLFNWEGGTKSALEAKEGVAALTADNSDYAEGNAPYRVKWNTEGHHIIISVASQPGKVSLGVKMLGGATTSTVAVQESTASNETFTDVETLTISGSKDDVVNLESTKSFKSTTRAIKLIFHKGSNVGLGPISIDGVVAYSDYMTTCVPEPTV